MCSKHILFIYSLKTVKNKNNECEKFNYFDALHKFSS